MGDDKVLCLVCGEPLTDREAENSAAEAETMRPRYGEAMMRIVRETHGPDGSAGNDCFGTALRELGSDPHRFQCCGTKFEPTDDTVTFGSGHAHRECEREWFRKHPEAAEVGRVLYPDLFPLPD